MDAPTPRGRPADLLTVRDPAQAAALLQPQRLRLLEGLSEPDSAAGLARRFGLPRQQVNYHLRELERAGLVELVEERRRGNCVERVMVAVARRVVISPDVLGGMDVGIGDTRDHFSPISLVAAAARTIRELGELQSRAAEGGSRLTTMTLESEVRFASVEARNAFAKELSDTVAHLVVKYHDAAAAEGLGFRVMVGAYPLLRRDDSAEPIDAQV
jgi:DNA-binding transcriptional ArsR family regulator